MATILGVSVRFRLLVLALAVGVLALGVVRAHSAPVDLLPEYAPPYAEIQTEALGLSAEEVEQLITVPLEQDLLNGVEGVDVIRSESVPGLSSIVLIFEPGSDIYTERQLVEERLTQAHALPHVSKPPTLLQPLSSASRVLMVGLSSAELDRIQQSVLAHWVMRPTLMGVPGVANVSIWGMRDQQLQVQVDPERLREQHVTLSQVVASAGNAQVVSPLTFLEGSTPGTGGFIETPQQRLQVRHLIETIADPVALGKVPVAGSDRLRLSDVADVRVDHQPLIGDAVVDGGAGLILVVEKFPEADPRDVTEGVEDALEALAPGLVGLDTDTSVFRPASYIDTALDNLWLFGLIGAVMMLLGLIAVRFRWRSMLVAVVTIPVSLAGAVLVLDLLGQTFNALVLGGLAAAVAVVIDEAVAPTERVMRRLRQRRRSSDTTSTSSIVLEASAEVRRPLLFATVIVLLAVSPVAVMEGNAGAFFEPLVLSYAVAVLVAMVVAVTLAPALTSLLTARWQPNHGESVWASRLQQRYVAALSGFSRTVWVPVAVAGAMGVVAVAVLPFMGASMLPTFRDPNVSVQLDGPPGTSGEQMTAVSTDLSQALAEIPGVAGVGAHVGRAVTGDEVTNVNSATVWTRIDPDADYDATYDDIEATVDATSGVEHQLLSYTDGRLTEIGALTSGENDVSDHDIALLSGTDQPLTVRLFGEDLRVLRDQATHIGNLMAQVDGVVDPQVELPEMQPTVEIEVDLDRAQQYGLTPGAVRRAEATLVQGIQVGSVFEEQKVFDVIVQGTQGTRGSVDDVRNLLIDTPDGGQVRLDAVADVRLSPTPAVIQRDAVSRRVDIVADVSDRSLDAVAADINRMLNETAMPLEYHAEVLTETDADAIGLPWVVAFAIGAAVAVYLLLQAAFGSWSLAGLTFVVLPLALTGGLLAVLVSGAELTLGSMVGFLAVFGLATRACTMLVAGVGSLAPHLPRVARADLVARAARERSSPVLASSVALALLALPFVVAGSRPGLEILHPMAVVVLGGVVTTALVTLFVLPGLCAAVGPSARHGAAADRTDRVTDADSDSGRDKRPERRLEPTPLAYDGGLS